MYFCCYARKRRSTIRWHLARFSIPGLSNFFCTILRLHFTAPLENHSIQARRRPWLPSIPTMGALIGPIDLRKGGTRAELLFAHDEPHSLASLARYSLLRVCSSQSHRFTDLHPLAMKLCDISCSVPEPYARINSDDGSLFVQCSYAPSVSSGQALLYSHRADRCDGCPPDGESCFLD